MLALGTFALADVSLISFWPDLGIAVPRPLQTSPTSTERGNKACKIARPLLLDNRDESSTKEVFALRTFGTRGSITCRRLGPVPGQRIRSIPPCSFLSTMPKLPTSKDIRLSEYSCVMRKKRPWSDLRIIPSFAAHRNHDISWSPKFFIVLLKYKSPDPIFAVSSSFLLIHHKNPYTVIRVHITRAPC